MTEKEKQEIIELVHKTLRGFFGPFPEGELGARPFTQTEKVLLKVNKVLCEKIKEMPVEERPHRKWIFHDTYTVCGNCGKHFPYKNHKKNFCDECGADMRKEGEAE